MTNLNDYLQDGASNSARAVLMLIQGIEIENSWCDKKLKYLAEFNIGRWENCREQGYIISLRSEDYSRQLNIIFFEHRNSDNICSVKWEQLSMNNITIDNAVFGDIYTTKYDVSHSLSYNQQYDMAIWIKDELNKFWNESSKK